MVRPAAEGGAVEAGLVGEVELGPITLKGPGDVEHSCVFADSRYESVE